MYVHVYDVLYMLQLFDVDEDNSITRDEFASLLRSTLGVCDLDVTKLFNEIDIDGSDHITYGEYAVYTVQKFSLPLSSCFFFSLEGNRSNRTLYIVQLVENSELHVHVTFCIKLMTCYNMRPKS